MYLLYTDGPAPSDIQTFTAEQLFEVSKAAEDRHDRHRMLLSIVFDLVQYGLTEKANALLKMGLDDDEYFMYLFWDSNDLLTHVLEVNKWPKEAMIGFVELLSQHDLPTTIL